VEQLKLLKTNNKENTDLEEYRFVSVCLQMGLTIQDLKELEYIDIAKIMIANIPQDKKYRKATAEDWDRLM
jgi:hypothetical protein